MQAKKTLQILIGILVAILVLPEIIPLNFVAGFVLPEVEKSIGRKIAIDGLIKLRLFPYPRVVVRGVRLENAKGAHHKSMASVNTIVVHVDFMPLLRQQIVVSGRIVHPVMNLQDFGKNKNNWTLGVPSPKTPAQKLEPKTSTGSSGWQLSVRQFKISGGSVEYRAPGSVSKVTFKTGTLGAKTLDEGPFFAHVRFGYGGQFYDASVRTHTNLSAPQTHITSKFVARDGRFQVGFIGDLQMKTMRVQGKADVQASMQRLGLNDVLLRHKAAHPRTHVIISSAVDMRPESVSLDKTTIQIPMTKITGSSLVKLGSHLMVKANLHTPDKKSFMNLVTKPESEGLIHTCTCNIDQMKSLLQLYGVLSPIDAGESLQFEVQLLQKGTAYTLQEAKASLGAAEVNFGGEVASPKGLMDLSGDVHIKGLRKWWQILNRDHLPGLDWIKLNVKANQTHPDTFAFDASANLEDQGAINIKGTQESKTINADVKVTYPELQDLAHHLSGDRSYKMGAFTCGANVRYSPEKTVLDNIHFASKPIDGKGTLTVEIKGLTTHVTSDLILNDLNLTNLMELLDDDDGDEIVERYKPLTYAEHATEKLKKAAAKTQITAKILDPGWPRKLLPWPSNIVVKAHINVGNLVLVQPLVQNSTIDITLDKKAQIKFTGKSALAQKPCHLNLMITPVNDRRDINLDMAFNEIPFNSLMGHMTNILSFGGGLTAKSQIKMSGQSVDALMKSMTGDISIDSRGAFIDGVNLIKLSRKPASIISLALQIFFKKSDAGIQKALGFFSLKSKDSKENKDRTEIFKLQARVPIRSGKASFVDTVLDAEGMKGNIAGYVDLGKRYVDTKGSFELPEIQLKDMPPIKFHAQGAFADVHVDHTANKLKDYFVSNILTSVIGKGVAQGLLSVLLPGVGTVIGIAAGEVVDRANDAALDAEIEKERNDRVAKHVSQPKPAPEKKSQNPLKSISKDLKKSLGKLLG